MTKNNKKKQRPEEFALQILDEIMETSAHLSDDQLIAMAQAYATVGQAMNARNEVQESREDIPTETSMPEEDSAPMALAMPKEESKPEEFVPTKELPMSLREKIEAEVKKRAG